MEDAYRQLAGEWQKAYEALSKPPNLKVSEGQCVL